ncbi:hypothetical protein HKX48_005708 [Thoreauomyces humboldtii]|nr:hypothetical protein HKX48_005708 [Thoreauomyces humboldtii]
MTTERVLRLPRSAKDALQSMYESRIGEKLKALENGVDPAVPFDQPFVVRLDGVAFSTFTKGLVKPFDLRLTKAMADTACDLLTRFTPVTAYVQSDEISLVFPAAGTKESQDPTDAELSQGPKKKKAKTQPCHIYTGRMQKVASVTASYASARINYHLSKYNWDDLNPVVAERMLSHVAHFDGRIVPLPSDDLVMECIFWRSNFDGVRNAVSQIAHAEFKTQELHKKTVNDQLDMLAAKGIDPFVDYDPRHLYGTWVKKEQFEMHGMINHKTKEVLKNPVIRHRVRTGSFNWAEWSAADRTEFTISKLWTKGDDAPPRHPLPDTGAGSTVHSEGTPSQPVVSPINTSV